MGHSTFSIWLTGYLMGGLSAGSAYWLVCQYDRRRNLHRSKHNRNNPTNRHNQRH